MTGTATKKQAAYSLDQLAEQTSMSKAFYRKEVRSGRLRAKLIGRRVVVLAADAERYLTDAPDWTGGESPKVNDMPGIKRGRKPITDR